MLLPLWEPCVPVGLQVGARKPLQLLGAAAVLTQGGAASGSEMVGQAGLQSDCRHLGLHLPWVRLRRTGCPFPGCEPAAPSGRSRPHTASGGQGCELTGLLGSCCHKTSVNELVVVGFSVTFFWASRSQGGNDGSPWCGPLPFVPAWPTFCLVNYF